MRKTAEAARNKWRGILLELGIPEQFLRDKHGPCPLCQDGTDRYRWDNKGGNGSFFCNTCGAGSGFDLLQRFKGWDFKKAATEVDRVLGNVRADPPRRERSAESHRDMLNRLWKAGAKIKSGDPVETYLASRKVDLPQNSDCLRYVDQCPVPNEAGKRMAMVAMIRGADGHPVNLHRTFLTPQGRKADMEQPRACMPGEMPDGCAIRLSMHGERLGIAEGIETALAATKRFGIPTWAAVNATMMAKWTPPEGVKEVVIFGDNDPKFGGAAAAYTLAHRLAARCNLAVEVRIPHEPGTDWADAHAA